MDNKIILPSLVLAAAPLYFAYHGTAVPEHETTVSAGIVSSWPTIRFESSSPIIEASSPMIKADHLRPVIKSEKYVLDKAESVLTWKCSMAVAGTGGHDGYISLSKGEFTIEKGQLTGGSVEVDMNSIADEFHRGDNGLISHLKSPDFFSVSEFPISTFTITKVAPGDDENLNVTGDLTIKEVTHEVTFPVKADVNGKILTANGKLTIDRTQWDIRYRSGKFFDDLADKAISDEIEFDMKIVARR